jgi:hypothetical protein
VKFLAMNVVLRGATSFAATRRRHHRDIYDAAPFKWAGDDAGLAWADHLRAVGDRAQTAGRLASYAVLGGWFVVGLVYYAVRHRKPGVFREVFDESFWLRPVRQLLARGRYNCLLAR